MTMTYEADMYYRISPFAKNWIATSGVMNHCERNRCYWVLDTLASYAPELAKRQGVDYFLIVRVEVHPDQTADFIINFQDFINPHPAAITSIMTFLASFSMIKLLFFNPVP